MHILIAGYGWLGRSIAEHLGREGHRVTGVRRSPHGEAGTAGPRIALLSADLSEPGSMARLPRKVDGIVACQAARGGGVAAYREAYVQTTRNLLRWAGERGVGSFVYTSSTGVFGYDDGRDVDEATPTRPGSESSAILVEAEESVREAAAEGLRTCVVRLSGLYGPERFGVVDRVRSGRLALGPGDDAWMNFCHRDDAVATVVAALERGRAGAVYHGSDTAPARRRDVVTWIAGRLRIPPPSNDGDPFRSTGGGRGANRRVLSEKTRSELGLSPRYPSFRDGLAPVFERPAYAPSTSRTDS
jgi:nucleoside-diphosphate-sugar epimerase